MVIVDIKDYQKKKQPKRKIRSTVALKAAFWLGLAAIVLLLGGGKIKDLAAVMFVKTVCAGESVLEDTRAATFLVIRKEKPVFAPSGGLFQKKFQEGERVAKNVEAGYLVTTGGTSIETTQRVAVSSPSAGIISYLTDGYEGVCNPEIWPELDINQLVELSRILEEKTATNYPAGGQVEPGQRLFRIIDNLVPSYLFADIDLPEAVLQANTAVDILFDDLEGLRITGIIKDVAETGDFKGALIEIPPRAELRYSRIIKGRIVVEQFHGVVVDQKVLVKKNEQTGVYLQVKGSVKWQEVKIAGTVGDQVALEGLTAADWVITTPQLVKEGQKIIFNKK